MIYLLFALVDLHQMFIEINLQYQSESMLLQMIQSRGERKQSPKMCLYMSVAVRHAGCSRRTLSGFSGVDLVDHGLSQRLQHLPLVVVEVSVDLVDRAVLHHPQLALSLCDEPGVVTHDDHSWTERESLLVLEESFIYVFICFYSDLPSLISINIFCI